MVNKTKIKRFQLTIDIILIAFFAMTAAVMLVSAYGAVCVTYNLPPPSPMMPAFWVSSPHIPKFLAIYVTVNIITWTFAFAWGIVIYAFLTRRRWAHWGAVFTATVGFLSGLITAILSDTEGFTVEFTGIGSPHWGRTLLNLVVLMILGIVLIIPATRKGLLSFLATGETRMSGNVARQLIMMSLFFFWLAAFSFLGSEFMRNAHVIDGVNIWSTIQIQFVGGIVTALIGSSMLAGGLIVSQIKRPSSLLKPL
jgi:hypothetical protein